MAIKSLAVYCGENESMDPRHAMAAEIMGMAIARSGRTLVYGGSRKGLMGVVADAALAAGGKVVGVALEGLTDIHPDLTELHVVKTLSERKDKMIALSDGSVTLPGGDGTLDEYYGERTEIKVAIKAVERGLVSERNLKLADRRAVIFDPDGHYLPQRKQAQNSSRVKKNNSDLKRFVVGETPAEVFEELGISDAPFLANKYLRYPVPGKGFLGALLTKRRYRKNAAVGNMSIKETFRAGQAQACAWFAPVYGVMAAAVHSDLAGGVMTPDKLHGSLAVTGLLVLMNFVIASEAVLERSLTLRKNDPDQPQPYRNLIFASSNPK